MARNKQWRGCENTMLQIVDGWNYIIEPTDTDFLGNVQKSLAGQSEIVQFSFVIYT